MGLRAQHLVDALKSAHRVVLLRDLTRVVQTLVDGPESAFIAPYLAGAKLAALDKTKRGVCDVRPIAVGQIVRRIAAKCLYVIVKGKAAAFFRTTSSYSRSTSRTRSILPHVRVSGLSDGALFRDRSVGQLLLWPARWRGPAVVVR
jgi:hypothetical protein